MATWKKISPEQAARFAAALPTDASLTQRQMFGCPIALVNGNMFAGVHNDEINVRLAETDRRRFLADYAEARIFSPLKGMEMKEYVVIPEEVASDASLLKAWIRRGFEFAASLAPRKKKASSKGKPKTSAKKSRKAPARVK